MNEYVKELLDNAIKCYKSGYKRNAYQKYQYAKGFNMARSLYSDESIKDFQKSYEEMKQYIIDNLPELTDHEKLLDFYL